MFRTNEMVLCGSPSQMKYQISAASNAKVMVWRSIGVHGLSKLLISSAGETINANWKYLGNISLINSFNNVQNLKCSEKQRWTV